jgi:hypothetical protein
MKCMQCADQRWVCEAHAERPWIGDYACQCGAAGMPCPACNPCDDIDPPRLRPSVADEQEISSRH